MRTSGEPDGTSTATLAFDAATGEITGPAGVARLAPQPASLLAFLIERDGGVATRDDIKEHLWPDGKVEFEQGIAFAVREIRKGLEEAGLDPELVETLPRRGYRLLQRQSGASATGPASATRLGSATPVLIVAGALITAGAFLWGRRPEPPPPPIVAIIQHASDGAATAPVALDIATALTTVLTDSMAAEAGIIGPTGTAIMDGANDMVRARSELGACLILSGMVREVGPDSVDVFTQLVRTSDRVHVWASRDTFPRADAVAGVLVEVLAGARESALDC